MRRKPNLVALLAIPFLFFASTGFAGAQGKESATFWRALGGHNGEVTAQMIDMFEKAYPNIDIKDTFTGDYYETQSKVMAAIAAGSPPAMAQIMDESIAMFANADLLEDLTPYAKGTKGDYKIDTNDFIKGFMWYSQPKGKLVALPWNKSTPLVYYNKDMFKAAGVPEPNPGWTWAEFQAAAEKLTIKKDGVTTVYGCEIPVDEWFWEALMWGNGGDFFNADMTKTLVNQPRAVEVTQWWVDMTNKGIMKAPPGKDYDAWDAARVDFISNKTAIIFASTGNLAGFKDTVNFGTAFMPRGKKGFATPYGGAHLVIFKGAPAAEKNAAWKFIAWLTDKNQTAYFAKNTGYMPVRTSAMSSPDMQAQLKANPPLAIAVKQLDYSRGLPLNVHMIEILDKIRGAALSAVLGETTAQKAMDDVAVTIDALLKE
ncbi:MAG: ABC transporter substrate-binding protein [Spirochaetota bacterium]